ncbi:hypothetical protein BJY21_001473 [Kineosphaera limosa]|uniref:hypothetical protein n=1 Tax=Kineosphaera limosa TaxID=111564 RepID=UPI0002DE6A6C|nr:hypothetical protein [Kineosphaera limosa]NYE00289.1 hypothetical protein [Kineosphaera limosa]
MSLHLPQLTLPVRRRRLAGRPTTSVVDSSAASASSAYGVLPACGSSVRPRASQRALAISLGNGRL